MFFAGMLVAGLLTKLVDIFFSKGLQNLDERKTRALSEFCKSNYLIEKDRFQ
jgi:hypothetical protein